MTHKKDATKKKEMAQKEDVPPEPSMENLEEVSARVREVWRVLYALVQVQMGESRLVKIATVHRVQVPTEERWVL